MAILVHANNYDEWCTKALIKANWFRKKVGKLEIYHNHRYPFRSSEEEYEAFDKCSSIHTKPWEGTRNIYETAVIYQVNREQFFYSLTNAAVFTQIIVRNSQHIWDCCDLCGKAESNFLNHWQMLQYLKPCEGTRNIYDTTVIYEVHLGAFS
jgi:hypothetical protein